MNRPAPPSRARREAGTGRRAPPVLELGDLVGVQIDVHDTEQAPALIDHRERQEAVLDEEFARLQNGSSRRQGHHLAHHDLGHRLFRHREQQCDGSAPRPRGEPARPQRRDRGCAPPVAAGAGRRVPRPPTGSRRSVRSPAEVPGHRVVQPGLRQRGRRGTALVRGRHLPH